MLMAYFPEKTWNFTSKRRGQVNIIVIEHFKSNAFHKSGSANKQHTNQSIYKYFCSKKEMTPHHGQDVELK